MGTGRISDTAACLGYPCANTPTHLYVVLMGNKVGYKRRDVYGTLLPWPPNPTPTSRSKFINLPQPLNHSQLRTMIRYFLHIQFVRTHQKEGRGVTAGKHVMGSKSKKIVKALEVR